MASKTKEAAEATETREEPAEGPLMEGGVLAAAKKLLQKAKERGYVSYDEIKTSTLQSRALAGVANATYIFCLPGSSGACRTAWDTIIAAQLDYRTRPCNLVELMPRLLET